METSTLLPDFVDYNVSASRDAAGQLRSGSVFGLPSNSWQIAWYFVPVLLGLPCNLLAICTYVRNPLLRRGKPVNYLILNLVISDFISCIVSLFYTILNNTQVGKLFAWKHKYACLALLATARTPPQSSLLCLLMLSFERLVAIIYPLKHVKLVTGRSVKVAITLCWLFLFGKALVSFWWNDWTGGTPCIGSFVYPDLYSVFLVQLPLYVCLGLTSLFNIIVGVFAFRRKQGISLGIGTGECDQDQETRSLKEKRAEYKVIKMLLFLVGVFFLTWLPVKVIGTIIRYHHGGKIPEKVFVVYQSVRVLRSLNLVLDPFICLRMNTQFKRAYYDMCSWRSKQRMVNNGNAMSVMATSHVIVENTNSE